MKRKFKIFNWVAVIASFAMFSVSCNQDAEFEDSLVSNDSRELISFNVTTTRGAIVSDLKEFSIYAVDDKTKDVIIDHAKFTLENGVWATDEDFYWTNNSISFYAYTPTTTTSNGVTMSEGVITYNMPSDVTAQPDLMTAYANVSSGNVSLQFSRIASLVRFSVKGEGSDIESITMSGIQDSGKHAIIDLKADGAEVAWSSTSKSGVSYAAGIGTADDSGQITTNDGYIIVIPQSESIVVTATNYDGGSKDYPISVDWEAGTLYNYTIDKSGIITLQTGIELTPSQVTLEVGATATTTLSSLPSGSTLSGDYTYEVGLVSIATVTEDDGVYTITGVSAGTTTLTVTKTDDETITATCDITIEAPKVEVSEDCDYTGLDDSNCYIINPSTTQKVYHFPIESRINAYWGSSTYGNNSTYTITSSNRSTITVSRLWQDYSTTTDTDLEVSLVENEDGAMVMQVVVPANYTKYCNELYAVKNSAGTILWSWHLWVTNYDPYTSEDVFLDRYVGQKLTTAIGGTMLYQYGRKDPFASGKYTTTTSYTSAMSTAVNNPTIRYGSSQAYLWLSSMLVSSDKWGDTKASSSVKSIYDPSPYGYKVPTSNVLGRYKSSYITIYSSYVYSSYKKEYLMNTSSMADIYYLGTNDNVNFWTTTFGSTFSNMPTLYIYRAYQMTNIGSTSDIGETQYYGRPRDLLPVRAVQE